MKRSVAIRMALRIVVPAVLTILVVGCDSAGSSDDDGPQDYHVTGIRMYAGEGTEDQSDDTVLWLEADLQDTVVDGQLEARVEFDEDGDGTIDQDDPDESVVERYTTEYGLITMVRSYANLDHDGQFDNLIEEITYTRGDYGYLTRTHREDSDHDGDLGDADDQVPYRQTRTYTQAGLVQNMQTHADEDRDGTYELYWGREEYTYNADGALIALNRYRDFDDDGTPDDLESSVTITYDGQGRIVSFTTQEDTDENGSLDATYGGVVEYDNNSCPTYIYVEVSPDEDYGCALTWEAGRGYPEIDDLQAYSGGFIDLTSWFHFNTVMN